jgi:hypothetical protein
MKICWDNIENLKLTKTGFFIKGTTTYILKESCDVCGFECLVQKYRNSKVCSKSCARNKKSLRKETITKMSIITTRRNTGNVLSEETKTKISNSHLKLKGGVYKDKLPLYDTYSHQINFAEETRCFYDENKRKLLEVKCSKCNKWYIPKNYNVRSRILALNGKISGERKFYCSDSCKNSCEVYGKRAEDYITINNKIYFSKYELNIWCKEILSRANYTCEICGNKATAAHHIQPKKIAPMFALDPENGVALCKECHFKYGHKNECNYGILRKSIKNNC